MKKLLLIMAFLLGAFAFAQTNEFYITDDTSMAKNERPHPFSPEQLEAAKHAGDSRPAKDDPEGNWGTVSEGFQLSVRLEKNLFTNGEPVKACVILRNVSDKTLPFMITIFGEPVMKTTLTRGNDILTSFDEQPGTNYTDSIRKLKTESRTLYQSPPGTQRKFFFDLNTIYDLSASGDYEVQVRKIIAKMNEHAKAEVVSGKAKFQITARP